jgi:RNA polymerase sigma factor (sigma-70 family)
VNEQASREALAGVVREHAGRLAASLVSLLGDFSAAEDLVQDAVETALRRWPVEGVPERPDAWLFTVARRRGLDVLRRESNYRAKLAQLTWPAPAVPDDRLRLVFTCCHPALSRAAQIALTLRVVCGLSTAQIAAAFVVPEATVAQRITRAKRKIGEAGIPYRIPAVEELPERLGEVLAVIYLLFNEGYLASGPRRGPPPYQVQAAIVACHAEAETFADTDWPQIVMLYDMLLYLAPSPVTRLHRAIAVRYAQGAEAVLTELKDLGQALERYPLFHATRAELLRDLGHRQEARQADGRALELTTNPAHQALLEERISWA